MEFIHSDGGRSEYFSAKNVGDCATRAIANATGLDYKLVYDALSAIAGKSIRNGCPKRADKTLLKAIGWSFVPTMGIGTGCTTHLDPHDLPEGALVVQVSGHLTCVCDGVLYDTYDCSRGETRCVYGYHVKTPKYSKRKAEEILKGIIEAHKAAKSKSKGKYTAKQRKTRHGARKRLLGAYKDIAKTIRLTNEQAEYLEKLLFNELSEEYVYQMESPSPDPSRYAMTLEILKKVYKAPAGIVGTPLTIEARNTELCEIQKKARMAK